MVLAMLVCPALVVFTQEVVQENLAGVGSSRGLTVLLVIAVVVTISALAIGLGLVWLWEVQKRSQRKVSGIDHEVVSDASRHRSESRALPTQA